jgi:hypothetical protein
MNKQHLMYWYALKYDFQIVGVDIFLVSSRLEDRYRRIILKLILKE